MGLKKVTYTVPNLKSLVASSNSCVYCIENCNRSLTVLPVHLDNIKQSVNELLNGKITTYDTILEGIILGHKNIKVVNHVQLNDDGNFGLDYVSDIYIFKPEVGSQLTGEINKKSKDHIGVLVHSFLNASIPRPRSEDACPKTWKGFDVTIGQYVDFEVVKVDLMGRIPYILGKLIDVGEVNNDDKDSGIGGHESMEESSHARESMENLDLSTAELVKKKKRKKRKLSESPGHKCEYENDSKTQYNFGGLEEDTQNINIPKQKKEKSPFLGPDKRKQEDAIETREKTSKNQECLEGNTPSINESSFQKKKKKSIGSLQEDAIDKHENELKTQSSLDGLDDSTDNLSESSFKKKNKKSSVSLQYKREQEDSVEAYKKDSKSQNDLAYFEGNNTQNINELSFQKKKKKKKSIGSLEYKYEQVEAIESHENDLKTQSSLDGLEDNTCEFSFEKKKKKSSVSLQYKHKQEDGVEAHKKDSKSQNSLACFEDNTFNIKEPSSFQNKKKKKKSIDSVQYKYEQEDAIDKHENDLKTQNSFCCLKEDTHKLRESYSEKKKKRKKSYTDITETETFIIQQEIPVHKPFKDKKRKLSDLDLNLADESTRDLQNNNESMEVYEPRKKKKKKHYISA